MYSMLRARDIRVLLGLMHSSIVRGLHRECVHGQGHADTRRARVAKVEALRDVVVDVVAVKGSMNVSHLSEACLRSAALDSVLTADNFGIRLETTPVLGHWCRWGCSRRAFR
jgi:hypothetical protein